MWPESPLTDRGATALCEVQCGGATFLNADCVSTCDSSEFSGELDIVELPKTSDTFQFSFISDKNRVVQNECVLASVCAVGEKLTKYDVQ